MAELRTLAIWATRLGLLLALFYYISGVQGPREQAFSSAFIITLLFAVTFVPVEYHNTIKAYVTVGLRNTFIAAQLLFITLGTMAMGIFLRHLQRVGRGGHLGFYSRKHTPCL